MKLLLLHGAAINSSRAKLSSLKKGFDPFDIVVYEKGFDVNQVLGSLLTLPFLSNDRLIILENPPEDFAPHTLNTIPRTLILWFDHEVSEKKPVMEWVKDKGQVLYFEESKEVSVFPFLDYLADQDKKAFLEVDKLKRVGFDIQYLITMVFYLLRNLVTTPKKAPEFVRKKLAKQKERFELEDIKNLYNATRYKTRSDIIASYYKDILEIDFKIKSGLLEKDQAEVLLINLFLH